MSDIVFRDPTQKTRIIAELGSCHMGRCDRILEAIDLIAGTGIELKLQLFPNKPPYIPTNVYLDRSTFGAAFAYAQYKRVTVSASVFDKDSFDYLKNFDPTFIKFAFSKKDSYEMIEETITRGSEAIVSCDVMSDLKVPPGATKLYCIPEYPVRYQVDFSELFPRFDGFSDHTLGLHQTRAAIKAGAKIIEKHVRLGYEDETCPDAFFAVNLKDLIKANLTEIRHFNDVSST